MKTLIVLALSLVISQSVTARSVHPCTPYVEGQPTRMSCVQDGKNFSVKVTTLSSPMIELCQDENFFTYETARVKVGNGLGDVLEVKEYAQGEFSYELNGATGSFKSKDFDLKDCAVPQFGAVSFGN